MQTPTQNITVRLPHATRERLWAIRKATGRPVAGLLFEALEEVIRRYPEEKISEFVGAAGRVHEITEIDLI